MLLTMVAMLCRKESPTLGAADVEKLRKFEAFVRFGWKMMDRYDMQYSLHNKELYICDISYIHI